MIRKNASWAPICTNAGAISDRGGKCTIMSTVNKHYNATVDEMYIKKAHQIMYQRLLNCRKFAVRSQNAPVLKKARWIGALISECSPEKIPEFDTWDFYLNKPANEVEKFWKTNDISYYEKHLPKSGNYNGYYSKRQKFRIHLDFIKLEKRAFEIVDGEERLSSGSSCKKL